MDGNYPQNPNGSPSGGEMFVGLNVLSKIGVVFIIVGIIAFSAVSGGVIAEWLRLAMILALGAVMIILGEVFRKKGSVVFGNTLIFGGVSELFISMMSGRFGLRCTGDWALLIGGVAALAGLLLAVRHESRTLLIITAVGAMLTMMTAASLVGYLLSGVLLVALHAGNALVCRKFGFAAPQFVAVGLAFYEGIYLCTVDRGLGICIMVDGLSGIYAALFLTVAGAVYSGGALLDSLERNGGMNASEVSLLVIPQGIALLLPSFFFNVPREVLGVFSLVLAVVYAVCVMFFANRAGSRSRACGVLINLLLSALAVSILRLFPAVWSYMIFHVFAAAVAAAGLFSRRKLLLGWGYGALAFAEILFLFDRVFSWGNIGLRAAAFALNAALWAALMAVFAVKGKRGIGFQFYSVGTLFNIGFFGIYIISQFLTPALGAFSESRHLFEYLLTAAMWMLLGFAAGKLAFLRKGASAGASLALYSFGMCMLLAANCSDEAGSGGILPVIVYCAVNVASVLAALDMALRIKSLAPKFARAVGLVTSFYGLMTLTVVFGVNGWAAFTSCVISIAYLLTSAAWIGIGFARRNALLRRFGLALALFSSAKLFLFDFRGMDAVGRTLMFIGFGITLLAISFTYGCFEKRLWDKERRK